MKKKLAGVTINGKLYQSIKAVPLYRAVRTYTGHMGPEQHAVLGNLRWLLEMSSLVVGEFFVAETETELLSAFNFEKSPQGFAYWFRVAQEMDSGRIDYNTLRAVYKLELRQRKQEQSQQQVQS